METKKICAFYSSSTGCRNGKNCKFEHLDGQKKEPCKFFNTSTGCKYGNK